MRNPLACLAVSALAVSVLPACHDDGLGLHGCPTTYTDDWRRYSLHLEHVDPSSCPRFLEFPGQLLSTGADVVDDFPVEMEGSFLQVLTQQDRSVGSEIVGFGSFGGRWVAQHNVLYQAGTLDGAPDIAKYDLAPLSGRIGPRAEMTITYSSDVVATISGPAAIPDVGAYTWTASVSQGVPPFTYRWYRDWEPVGSEASYTDEGGAAAEMELRLDVHDARGYAASSTRRVTVTHCEGTELRC